ncbi:DENN domain-containing protein 2A-like isoform X2 [Elysia marginata]|uniref:DENN domain-containing protein 2A-like isoform X2 n=1 Tax=Elysia marginata TaxID=1093978 RepID=A0AAV4HVF6_9GAST|nr:DENN domain-containing protein 2A-like isoform X2 [Elysia marginata]
MNKLVEVSPGQFLTKLPGFEASKNSSLSGGGNASKDDHKGGKWQTARHDITKVTKKKLIMVREKINQAYAALEVAMRGQGDGEDETWDSSDVTVSSRPVSEELVVEATELQRRIEYCTGVRLKSTKSIKRTKEYRDVIYPQLFEYCLVVGLRQQTDVPGYEPFLIHKFPENVSSNLSVPSFCFPDASIFKPGSATSISDLALEVIAASFGRPLPKPGKVCHIRTLDSSGEMETIFLNRPTDNRLDDVNYESPLFYLGTDRLVKVFSSMLMERRIILCSSNLSTLTQTVHALSALLYPFHWQHVYVPLLPEEMLDVVCAPMPYILGVLSAFLPQVLKMDTEQVFIVDLDKKSIVKSQGDESTILPRKVQRALKTAINMCKIDSEAQNAQWLMVAEAFLRMFIETIGHFTNHVRTQQDGNRIFQKEGFILEMVSKELRQFLEWFTETQMFEVFIVDLVEKPDLLSNNDLFMQRLKEHRESKEENNRRKGLGAKVKNFGKALKTKLQS